MKGLLFRIKRTMPKGHRAPHEAPAPPPPFDGDSEGSCDSRSDLGPPDAGRRSGDSLSPSAGAAPGSRGMNPSEIAASGWTFPPDGPPRPSGGSAEEGESGLDFPPGAAPPPPRGSRRLRSDGSDISRDHEDDGGSASRSAPRRQGHSKAKHPDSYRRRRTVEDEMSDGSDGEGPSSRSCDRNLTRRHTHQVPAHPDLAKFLTGGPRRRKRNEGPRQHSWSGFFFDKRETDKREKPSYSRHGADSHSER